VRITVKCQSGKEAEMRFSHVVFTAATGGLMAVAATTQALQTKPPDFTNLNAAALSGATAPGSMMTSSAMLAVPAGTYPIGRADKARDQRPAHNVSLPSFRIDRTEVTNEAFAEYLNALELRVTVAFGIGEMTSQSASNDVADLLMEGPEGSGLYPIIALDDEQARIIHDGTKFLAAAGYENHSVAETTWAGARAYCVWRGGELPSEAQWEAAARGSDDRLYPWGDAAPSAQTAFVSGQAGVTGLVGQRPAGASPFEVLDMSGSMAEWTLSLKLPYPYVPTDGREASDRAGERVTRGGDYLYDAEPASMTVSHRNGFSNAPERGHRHIGFRCVAS
jgi:gamma-glutamyl hercynylcysteine S-oxide synthase